MGFVILTFIWIFLLVYATPMFLTLALHLNFEGAKNIQVLQVLIWGIGRHCRFLTKCKKTSIFFNSSFRALEDAGGS